MTDGHPLVSILMTAFNRENYIREAIESVLASTYKNFELIIVDDCSSDKTVEIAKSYSAKDERVKVFVNETNLGDYPNRNRAASYAQGKYIKFLDSDDLIYYYGLEVMVNYMERFPEAGFALASMVEDEMPFPVCIGPRQIYLENFSRFGHFDRAPGSSIIRTDVFKELGGFSGKRMIGDTEFWMKIAMYYPMVKMPFDLYWSRVHTAREFASGYALQNYTRLRREIMMQALEHPDCPLQDTEKRKIVKQYLENNMARRILKRIQFLYKRN